MNEVKIKNILISHFHFPLTAEILELVQKLNKNITFQEILTDTGVKTIAAQHIFDSVADEMTFKQENDPTFMPLDVVIGNRTNTEEETSKDDEVLVGNLAFADNEKNDSLSHIRSKMLVSQLNSLLKSKNDILKYEYIEMIRNGNEEELMKYLLKDPSNENANQFNAELEKKLRRKLVILNFSKKTKNFKLKNEENSIIIKTQEIQKKLLSDKPRNILQKIETSIRTTDRLLGSSLEYYENIKIKDSKEKEEGISSIYEDSDLFIAKKYQKIVEQGNKRDERMALAKKERDKLKEQKEEDIMKTIHKKSIDYKKKLAKIRIEQDVFNEKLKKMMIGLNVNIILEFIHSLLREGILSDFTLIHEK